MRFLRGVASLLIGLPVAIISTVTIGAARLALSTADIALSYVRKLSNYGREVRRVEALHSAVKALDKTMGNIWRKFGLGWVLDSAEYIYNHTTKATSNLGFFQSFLGRNTSNDYESLEDVPAVTAVPDQPEPVDLDSKDVHLDTAIPPQETSPTKTPHPTDSSLLGVHNINHSHSSGAAAV